MNMKVVSSQIEEGKINILIANFDQLRVSEINLDVIRENKLRIPIVKVRTEQTGIAVPIKESETQNYKKILRDKDDNPFIICGIKFKEKAK